MANREFKIKVTIQNINDDEERFEEIYHPFKANDLEAILEDLHTDFGVWYCQLTGQKRSHE